MLLKGDKFFLEVRDSLEKLRTRFSSSLMKQSLSLGSVKEFHEIEEMLVHDKADFEVLCAILYFFFYLETYFML